MGMTGMDIVIYAQYIARADRDGDNLSLRFGRIDFCHIDHGGLAG